MLDRTIAPAAQKFQKFSLKRVQTHQIGKVPVHFLVSGSQPILRIEFVFKAGTWYEDKSGLSYLTSKMLNEGTDSRSAKEIAEIIAEHGAFLEIHHGLDHVNITFYLLEKHFETLLPLFVDILTRSIFPSLELTNLKNVTNQNLKVNKEKGQFISSVEFRKALFGITHPYGTQYWEQDVENLRQEELTDFFKRYFALSNLEVFVAGQFDADKLIGLLGKYLQTQDVPPVSFHKAPTYQPNYTPLVLERKDAMQSSIRLGCHCLSKKDPAYPYFAVLNELLGGFFGSRLMKNIREEKGYTYGIHSSIQSLKNASYLVVATDVKRENAQHTIDEVWKELDRLKKELVSKQELDTVKSYMLGKFMNSINTPFALMDKFKNIHFHQLDYTYFDLYIEKVQNVAPESLLELANSYFRKEQFCEVVVGGLS